MRMNRETSNEEMAKLIIVPTGRYAMALMKPLVKFENNDGEISSYFLKFGWIILGGCSGRRFEDTGSCAELNGWCESAKARSAITLFFLDKDGSISNGMESALTSLKKLGITQTVNDPSAFKTKMESDLPLNNDGVQCMYVVVDVRHFDRKDGATGIGFDIIERVIDPEKVTMLDESMRLYYSNATPPF